MESIIIVIAGLIFSVLSKSVKDKKEIEKERAKRKEQLSQEQHSTTSTPERKQKSLKEIFMEELDKVGDEDGNLGDIFKRTLGEEPQKEIQVKEMEAEKTSSNYESGEEYKAELEARVAAYMETSSIENDNEIAQSEIVAGETQAKHGVLAKKRNAKKQDKGKYNPFTKSLNKQDVVRGIIFSEVLGKPKSLRNERRSM